MCVAETLATGMVDPPCAQALQDQASLQMVRIKNLEKDLSDAKDQLAQENQARNTLQEEAGSQKIRIGCLEKELSHTKDLLMQEHHIRNSLELEVKRLASSTKILQHSTVSEFEGVIHNQQREIIRILAEKAEIERFVDLCKDKINLLEDVRALAFSQLKHAILILLLATEVEVHGPRRHCVDGTLSRLCPPGAKFASGCKRAHRLSATAGACHNYRHSPSAWICVCLNLCAGPVAGRWTRCELKFPSKRVTRGARRCPTKPW